MRRRFLTINTATIRYKTYCLGQKLVNFPIWYKYNVHNSDFSIFICNSSLLLATSPKRIVIFGKIKSCYFVLFHPIQWRSQADFRHPLVLSPFIDLGRSASVGIGSRRATAAPSPRDHQFSIVLAREPSIRNWFFKNLEESTVFKSSRTREDTPRSNAPSCPLPPLPPWSWTPPSTIQCGGTDLQARRKKSGANCIAFYNKN